MNSYLVDANVWLAISHKDHVHHRTALRWFDESEGMCCFCRITQLALLRLLTNVRVMGLSTKTQADAWKVYDLLTGRGDVLLVGEPPNLDSAFRELSKGGHRSPNAWNDAYLGALSRVLSMPFVTFDSDFRAMPGVDAVVLTRVH
jgi:toxin-antitoxin system PIN domain toxin